jgi:hypothetical protein
MKTPVLVGVLAAAVALSGCSAVKKVLGVADPGEPSIVIKSAEPRWLLIKNPRFGDVPSEPEYVWVEEDKVPTTMTTLLRGKSAIIAPPEIVAKYGTPPGGGKISPRQGTIYQTTEARPERAVRAAKNLDIAGWLVPVLLERRGAVTLDVTYISAVTGLALFSRRLPLLPSSAVEEQRFPWEPPVED